MKARYRNSPYKLLFVAVHTEEGYPKATHKYVHGSWFTSKDLRYFRRAVKEHKRKHGMAERWTILGLFGADAFVAGNISIRSLHCQYLVYRAAQSLKSHFRRDQ